jgi:hypothetical protein
LEVLIGIGTIIRNLTFLLLRSENQQIVQSCIGLERKVEFGEEEMHATGAGVD